MLFDMFFCVEIILQEHSQDTLPADLLLSYVCRMLSNSTLIKEDPHNGGVSNQFLSRMIIEETMYKDADKQENGHTRNIAITAKGQEKFRI